LSIGAAGAGKTDSTSKVEIFFLTGAEQITLESCYRSASSSEGHQAVVLLLFALMLVFSVPAQAQDAASVYKSKCVACHAADGSGDSQQARRWA
jgi:cytochrome c553